jgi:hypothetical protein
MAVEVPTTAQAVRTQAWITMTMMMMMVEVVVVVDDDDDDGDDDDDDDDDGAMIKTMLNAEDDDHIRLPFRWRVTTRFRWRARRRPPPPHHWPRPMSP